MKKKHKQLIKTILYSVPYFNRLFVSYLYRNKLKGSDQTLISFLQNTAHGIDHMISRAQRPYQSSIITLGVILKELKNRELEISDEVSWALEIYAIAKNGLSKGYSKSLKMQLESNPQKNLKNESCLIEKLIKTRRSVRLWQNDKKIEKSEIIDLIDIAKWAPSSCNRQTWKVLILENNNEKMFLTKLYKGHNKFWAKAPYVLVIMINIEPYFKEQEHYVYLDGAAFIQNLLLLCHEKGFGACWVGFHSWNNLGCTNKSEKKEFYSYFNVPESFMPISLIPVGYPAICPKVTRRKDVDGIIIV